MQATRSQLLSTLVLLAITSAPAASYAEHKVVFDKQWVTTVDLLTIGPGDHLWESMGHSALMAFTFRRDSKQLLAQAKALRQQAKQAADAASAAATSKQAAALELQAKQMKVTIYNYGDADFEAEGFIWSFFRGTVKFRSVSSESLPGFVQLYADANRTIVHQRLKLTPDQVRKVIAALEHDLKPANRYYAYHHMEAGCATKIRDLLDRALGGTIRQQLAGQPHPHTARHYGRLGLAGHLAAEVFNDLFMGRMHDLPMDRYYAMFHPQVMADYLQQVRLPAADGKGTVALLSPPMSTLCKRTGKGPGHGQGRSLIHLTYLLIALLLGLGFWAWRAPDQPRRAGWWLLIWSVPMGLAAGLMVFGALVSNVAEGRVNELMLAFPVTDLALIWIGVRWYRGRAVAGKLLRGYAVARVALVLLALALHAAGVLIQQPRVMLVLALVASAGLVAFTRRMNKA